MISGFSFKRIILLTKNKKEYKLGAGEEAAEKELLQESLPIEIDKIYYNCKWIFRDGSRITGPQKINAFLKPYIPTRDHAINFQVRRSSF